MKSLSAGGFSDERVRRLLEQLPAKESSLEKALQEAIRQF